MIDSALAEFLEEGLGIYVGTRNAALVYVAEIAAPRLLPDLESNSYIAVSVGRPKDDRACQLKGLFAGVRRAEDAERDRVIEQWERFRSALEYIGIARPISSAWVAWPALAIRFKVTAIFEQTPGPSAGTPVA
jgi:hypothetical protein